METIAERNRQTLESLIIDEDLNCVTLEFLKEFPRLNTLKISCCMST